MHELRGTPESLCKAVAPKNVIQLYRTQEVQNPQRQEVEQRLAGDRSGGDS